MMSLNGDKIDPTFFGKMWKTAVNRALRSGMGGYLT